MRHINESLYDLLMSQGLNAGDRAGTRKTARKQRAKAGTDASGIKGRDAANERAVSPVEAGKVGMNTMLPTGRRGGNSGPIYLCWSNPHMTKATGRRTSRVALVICE